MALSFEDEVRAFLKHGAEQDPTLNAMLRGEMTLANLDWTAAARLLARICADQTKMLIRAAQEIDKLGPAVS